MPKTFWVYYSDTLSPVAKLASVRKLISFAATHHWPLHQLDVKNAFLHGDLHEVVAQGEFGKVCILQKSLYGLKQSPRAWFGKFSQAVMKFGLKRSEYDHSLFYQNYVDGMLFLVVYVDDIVITGSNERGIYALKAFFSSLFQTKDLGPLKYFIGIEVARSKKGLFLSQRKYVIDLLAETGLTGAKPCETPMIPNEKLTADEGEPLRDPECYRRLVGKLNYLTVTRPDIAFSVSVVSQFMSSPRTTHWDAILRIMKYLKGAPGRGLVYKDHGHFEIEGFSDADWAGDALDRESITGNKYLIVIEDSSISWKSKK